MNFDRRKFLKTLGAGVALSAIPSPLIRAAEAKDTSRNLERKKHTDLPDLKCDVIVAGAGPSGIPAAIAAARLGASVILVEEDMAIGGATTDMFVTYMCGAPRTGIYLDVVKELNRNHPVDGTPSETMGEYAWDNKNHWWLPSAYQQVWNSLVARYDHIELLCGSPVIDTIVSDEGNRNRVKGVIVCRGGLTQRIFAPVTIDATGNGIVSAKSGCSFYYGSDARSDFNESIGMETSDGKVQPCTQMYISQRTRRDARFPLEAFKTGVLDDDDRLWASQQDEAYFAKKDTGAYLHWGATVDCQDTTDPVAVAKAQRIALEKLRPKLEVLHEAGYSTYIAPKIGIRESRRIKGDYVLTVDDILQRRMPDDMVADAWYSLDPWGIKLDEKLRNSVGPYGIPYRCLVPYATEGLLTAGRIISGTRLAMSSYRVQPICGTIGEAAGTAAALIAAHKTSVRNIDVREIQKTLDGYGIFDWYSKVGMKVDNKPWLK